MRNEEVLNKYQEAFKTQLKDHGKQRALDFMRELFAQELAPAYDDFGFEKGNAIDFANCVSSRDESLGLNVEVDLPQENKIVYRLHEDLFPQLKDIVAASEIDSTFLEFNVSYLLGEDWCVETSRHIWDGAPFSEYVITRINIE